MKSVGAAAAKKAEAKAETTDAAEETEEAPTGDNNGFFTPNDQIDFSKVKVEPLFGSRSTLIPSASPISVP